MNVKYIVIGAIAIAAVSSIITRRYFPKIETKSKTEVRNDIRTITKIVTRPDGTKETTKETIDNSVKTVESSKVKQNSRNTYNLGITAGTHLDTFEPIYGLQASLRILGPIFIGGYGRADGEFGIILSSEF